MAYVLGGSNGESNGFEKAIAGFALRAVHASTGLVDATRVATINQGTTYVIPKFAPMSYQDYDPSATSGSVQGDADEQVPAIEQSTITATPAVAATAFDAFLAQTTAFDLASSIGAELGESFSEKVDQRVAKAFLSFKATPGNTNYATSSDGFARPSALGAMELRASGATGGTATTGFTSTTVSELIRNIRSVWHNAGLSGTPVVVLDTQVTQSRLLGELTGGAVNNNVSNLGNELLTTGNIQNLYGCRVVFTRFLSTASRAVAGGSAENVRVGAYFGDNSIYTVIKSGLEIKMGLKPGGLQTWVTGLGFFGSGVADGRRGGAVNIEITA
jgi:hypothetical protein